PTNRTTAIARAERSLGFLTFATCLCMITVTFTNLSFLIHCSANLIFTLRPFQLDLLSFLPIWVLYFTHPVFTKRTATAKTIGVFITSSRHMPS
ncbi:hypothetical protein GCK32_010239, partial [Trichostrongylus colubriformis]